MKTAAKLFTWLCQHPGPQLISSLPVTNKDALTRALSILNRSYNVTVCGTPGQFPDWTCQFEG